MNASDVAAKWRSPQHVAIVPIAPNVAVDVANVVVIVVVVVVENAHANYDCCHCYYCHRRDFANTVEDVDRDLQEKCKSVSDLLCFVVDELYIKYTKPMSCRSCV